MVKLILEYKGYTCVCCGRQLCDCGEGAYDRVEVEDIVPEAVAEACVEKHSHGPWLRWSSQKSREQNALSLSWEDKVAADRAHQSQIWQWKGETVKVIE